MTAKKVPLNKFNHSVRAAQAVLQYGVGAMVDFPEQTLMTAAPEYWQDQVIEIHDERLEKVLKVDYFGLPASQDDPKGKEGISYARFPEWYFCPKCRKFQPIDAWVQEYKARQRQRSDDSNMVKKPQCTVCRQNLVVTRILTACECGHIDDFPWVKWVHCKNMTGSSEICASPVLTFKTSASSSEGLEGLTIECKSCGARATLKGAFDPDVFEKLDKKFGGRYDFHCTGRHPWNNLKEKCSKYPRAVQRGSSSVYFPVSASSLVIPPYSSLITKGVEDSASYAKYKDTIATFKTLDATDDKSLLDAFISKSIINCAEDISREKGIPADKAKSILERKWIDAAPEENESTNDIRYRAEEYEALSGEVSVADDEYGDFMRENTDISKYEVPHVKAISLINKIREVQALIGFSRLNPVEPGVDRDGSDFFVSIKEPATKWYPAYEVRGEGIFIELLEDDIADWIKRHPVVIERAEHLNENYKESFLGRNRPRKITAKFLLLHTLSHLLVKQLSFECGYSIASLKERLYCSEPSEGKAMAGILIYTASGDSEGTMGGLVRQGRSDVFPNIFKKAIESAVTCSNDPVCSLSMGQGRDSLNLAACYSCSLIPETSCEEYNIFLDRATIVGTYENRDIGFYSDWLYPLQQARNSEKSSEAKQESKPRSRFVIASDGMDLRELPYSEIWGDLKSWAATDKELKLITALEQAKNELSGKEKPFKDCEFKVSGDDESYMCDLYWPKSHVAYFSVDNEDCYNAAKDSDILCFFAGDEACTYDAVIKHLKEIK